MIELIHELPNQNCRPSHRKWLALCFCGNKYTPVKYSVTKGSSKSCGCVTPRNKTSEGDTTMIDRDSKPQELDAYWNEALQYRMEEFWEVVRLVTVARGFYQEHLEWESKEGGYREFSGLYDFCDRAKRPFGNKNTNQSIIFNLGWDYQRTMCFVSEPVWVTELADKLYRLVLLELRK